MIKDMIFLVINASLVVNLATGLVIAPRQMIVMDTTTVMDTIVMDTIVADEEVTKVEDFQEVVAVEVMFLYQ